MLILTRRIGEVLIIGDDVKITVLGVRGHQVRIGVDAPKNISVHSKEIYEQVHQPDNSKDDNVEHDKTIFLLLSLSTKNLIEFNSPMLAKWIKKSLCLICV